MSMTSAEVLLLLMFPFNTVSAEKPGHSAVMDSSVFPELVHPTDSYMSLILLALTVGLSGSVYLCVLRYICSGCCHPVVVGPEEESMIGMV